MICWDWRHGKLRTARRFAWTSIGHVTSFLHEATTASYDMMHGGDGELRWWTGHSRELGHRESTSKASAHGAGRAFAG